MSDRTCTTRIYKGVVVCNGHHKDKNYPDFLARLSGETLHSKDYEGPEQIEMGQPGSRRKLAAIISAGVVGYSRLMAADEAATVETLKFYRDIIARLVTRRGGRVVGLINGLDKPPVPPQGSWRRRATQFNSILPMGARTWWPQLPTTSISSSISSRLKRSRRSQSPTMTPRSWPRSGT